MAPSYSILHRPTPKLPKDNQSIEDIKFVEEHGYILFPSLLSPETVKAALDEIDRMTTPDALTGRNPFEVRLPTSESFLPSAVKFLPLSHYSLSIIRTYRFTGHQHKQNLLPPQQNPDIRPLHHHPAHPRLE